MPWKNGKFEVFVLNKLVASSDVVTNNVDILVEVCGGKDFSFATPVHPKLFPVTTSDIRRIDPPPAYADEDVELEPQIGLDTDLVPFVPDGTVNVGIEPEKMSIGEKVFSLRQMLKRFSFFQLAGKVNGTTYLNPQLAAIRNINVFKLDDDGNTQPVHICDVDFANVSYGDPQATLQGVGGTPLTQNFPFTTDLLTHVCALFAYNRGSIRMKFQQLSRIHQLCGNTVLLHVI